MSYTITQQINKSWATGQADSVTITVTPGGQNMLNIVSNEVPSSPDFPGMPGPLRIIKVQLVPENNGPSNPAITATASPIQPEIVSVNNVKAILLDANGKELGSNTIPVE